MMGVTLPLWVTALRRGQKQNAREEQRAVSRGVTTRQAQPVGGGASAPLLLDLVTGAAAAYSLRKLRTAYAGAAVRVRRSSDNAEQDIGFSGVDFDAGAFSAFIGGGSGFAAKWYDQTPNARDLVQSIALSQPQVMESTTLAGKYALSYDGSDDLIGANVGTFSQPNTLFAQVNWLSIPGGYAIWFDSNQNTFTYVARVGAGGGELYLGASRSLSATIPTNSIWSVLMDGNNSNVWINNVSAGGAPNGANGINGVRFGAARNNSSPANVEITDAILYNADKTADRAAVEANIADYYGL